MVTKHQVKSSSITGLEWPRGFQEVKVKQSRYKPGVARGFHEVKVPRFQENGAGRL
jgi:hypothetical protein